MILDTTETSNNDNSEKQDENVKEDIYKGLLRDKNSRDIDIPDMKPLWKQNPKPYQGRPDLDPNQTDPLAPFKQLFLGATSQNVKRNVHSPQASQSGSDALSPNGSNSGASGANALSPRGSASSPMGSALYRQSGNGNVHSPQASHSGSDVLSPNGSTSGASGALSPLGSALSALGSCLVPRVSALSPRGSVISPNRSNSGASGALSPMSPRGFALSPRGSALSPRGSALSSRVSVLSPMGSTLYRQSGNGNVYSSQASQSGSDVLSPNGSNSGASWNETSALLLNRPNSGASGANGFNETNSLSLNRPNSGASGANGFNETSALSLNRPNSGASGAIALLPYISNSGANGGANNGANRFLSPNGFNSAASGANGTSETLTPKEICRLSPNAIVKQYYDSLPKNADGTPAKPKSGTGTPESQRGLSALSPPTGSESGASGAVEANGANGAGGALRLVVEAIRMEVDEEISMEVDDEIQTSPNRGKPFSPNRQN